MKKTKKFIALLLVSILSLSVLSACGKSGNDTPTDTGSEGEEVTSNKSEEPIELTFYSQTANYNGEQIGWFAKVLLDRFNVVANIVNDGDGVFMTRMESGSLGDIVIFGADTDEYMEAIDKGMLFDWNEDNLLAEYGPYIQEHMAKALEKNMGISPDGTLYGFGHGVTLNAEDSEAFFYHPDIRWDLYAKLGYPEVNTLEDYIDVLAGMKELEPVSDSGKETYGVSLFNDWDDAMVMFVKATGALYGYDEFGIGLYNQETQEWESAVEEGGMYLRALSFYNQLYQRDLLDPDSMTQGWDGASEDYIDGSAFFSIFNYMASLQYNTEDHLTAGKAMYALAANDAKTLNYGLNVYGGNRVWTIGSKTQYPELCMEIINWLSTPEGRMTSEYGPQGLTWDYDEDGNTYLTDLGVATRQSSKTEMTGGYSGTFKDGNNQMANITWSIDASNPDSNGETYNYQMWPSWNARLSYEVLDDWRAHTGFTTQDEYLMARDHVIAPGTTFTMATRSDELNIIWEQVTKAIRDYTWQAIYAEDEAKFNQIVEEMRTKVYEYGFQQCIDFTIEQAALRKAAEDAVTK